MKRDSNSFQTNLFILFSLLFLIILGANYCIGMNFSLHERGIFGDMFGLSNAIFSGFACIGIAYAIVIQREELETIRSEAEHTRQLVDNQNEHLSKQSLDLTLRSAEETFFRMLNLLADITQNVAAPPGELGGAKSTELFIRIWNRAKNLEHQVIKQSEDNGLEIFCIRYSKEIKSVYQNSLGHYFRVLFNVLSFIDNSALVDKKFYAGILKAQLSNPEVQIIFYECSTQENKLKYYCEKYFLLEHADISLAISRELKNRFEGNAFTSS